MALHKEELNKSYRFWFHSKKLGFENYIATTIKKFSCYGNKVRRLFKLY